MKKKSQGEQSKLENNSNRKDLKCRTKLKRQKKKWLKSKKNKMKPTRNKKNKELSTKLK